MSDDPDDTTPAPGGPPKPDPGPPKAEPGMPGAGTPKADAGTPAAEPGTPRADAGPPRPDAGTSTSDTGPPKPEPGPPKAAASTPKTDAGTPEAEAETVVMEAVAAEEPAAEPAEPAVAAKAPAAGGASAAWRRIRQGMWPSRGQAIVAVVLGLVAFMAVVQVRQNLADDGYANARREDLIEILDGLGQSTRRLEAEITDLEARKARLSSGADRAENARAQAEEQIKVLGILAGTLPAQGPGVKITLTDPNGKVESGNLLDAIEELRDAGAEAIQINGRVRVVASTAFTDDPPGLRVDGEKVQAPYVIEAIGDSHNLNEAANFPGGLVSEITGPQINGTAEVEDVKTVRITALHTPEEHRYARPAASPTK